ncbi:MAG: precorrin-2 C(20)-methyltransferase [Desulfomonilaceae bacterium]|nr:precorrin-2 C(20)-methyltransferase [Desulfomonilaceae bacterium]
MERSLGTLYGIGVGPGDPELITVKGARLLAECRHVFVPRGRLASDCLALSIARTHMNPRAVVEEIVFPMTSDPVELSREWDRQVRPIAEILQRGLDACYVTLGDTLLYSTYVHMLGALRRRLPDASVVTLPGVPAFSAVAALAEFPMGTGRETITIVPGTDDLANITRALAAGGTIILMKIGKRLKSVLNLLDREGVLDRAVFVSHAGLENEIVEKDLRKLRDDTRDETGNLSVILVHGRDRA